MSKPNEEPLVHSHNTDVLPEDDPRADTDISCGRCKALVHAFNNECMRTWLEWDQYVLCGPCAAPLIADGVLHFDEFAERAQSNGRDALRRNVQP